MSKKFTRIFFLTVLISSLYILYDQVTKYNKLKISNSALVYIVENEDQKTFYVNEQNGQRIILPDEGYTQIYPSNKEKHTQYLINNFGFVELNNGEVKKYYSDLKEHPQVENHKEVFGTHKSMQEGSYVYDDVMYLYSVYQSAGNSYFRSFSTKTKETKELLINGEIHSIYYNPEKQEFNYVSKVDSWVNSLKVYKGVIKPGPSLSNTEGGIFTIPGVEGVQITAISSEKGIDCITCGKAMQYVINYAVVGDKVKKLTQTKLPKQYHYTTQLASENRAILINGDNFVGIYSAKTKKLLNIDVPFFDENMPYQLNEKTFTYLNKNFLVKKNADGKVVERIMVPLKPGEKVTAFNLP